MRRIYTIGAIYWKIAAETAVRFTSDTTPIIGRKQNRSDAISTKFRPPEQGTKWNFIYKPD
jgi:hypothetical protein